MPAAPVKFAYWVPNVSGGLVTSKIEQRTDWGYDHNRELAVLAENNGFEYALSQVRYMAGYGAEYQHESTGFSLPAARHRAAEGHRRRPPRPVAPRCARQVRRDRRPPVERPLRRQRRVGLVQGLTYTRTKSRPWLHGGHERAVDEPYVIDVYGDLTAKLWAVEALADTVAAEGQRLHEDPDAVTERTRGEFEVGVAAVKARATDVALEVATRVFEVTGARSTATATSEGLDRFWRDIRTHTLHDPVAYKRREVGRWVLEGELPEPTWYS